MYYLSFKIVFHLSTERDQIRYVERQKKEMLIQLQSRVM
jgi:hypothetical protein